MNHQEVYAIESAALEPTAWERWATRAERIAGHSLDGDGATDGYSLDEAYDAWQEGVTAADYVNRIRARRRNR